MKRALALAALVLVVGCKKKQSDNKRAIFVELRSKICACKDMACVQKVSDEFKARPDKPTFDQSVAEVYAETTKCMEAIRGVAGVGAGSGTAQPEIPLTIDADTLWRTARDWASTKYPGTYLRTMSAQYVDASGVVDPDHGELRFEWGAPEKPVDDPKRRTGAPISKDPKRVVVCGAARWLKEDRWHTWEQSCVDSPATTPRCSIQQVWKRAIEQGAPADAVAQVDYDSYLGERPWTFKISDEPRNVNISHRFADDCELAVEKP